MTEPLSFLPKLRFDLSERSGSELADLPQAAERWLIDHLTYNISSLAIPCCGTTAVSLPNGDIELGRGQIRSNVALSSTDLSRLEVVFLFVGLDIDKELLKTKTKSIPLKAIGQIDSIAVTAPISMNLDFDAVLETIKRICQAVYNVLQETIRLRIRSLTSDLAEELYFTFRAYCTDEKAKKEMWFAGVSDNYGFRLVDSKLGEEVVVDIPQAFGRSKASLSTEILDTAMPVEGLLMKHVFNTANPIDVDISNAEYGKQKSTYSEAMQALYKGSAFSIHPIYSDGNWAILALSSIQTRDTIWEIIDSNRKEFEAICQRSKNRVKAALKKVGLKDGSYWPQAWGKFVGAASSEFLKGMSGG